MSKNITIVFTPAQLQALVDITDTISAMVGAFDQDFTMENKKNVMLIDRALNNAGYKRVFK